MRFAGMLPASLLNLLMEIAGRIAGSEFAVADRGCDQRRVCSRSSRSRSPA